MGDGGLSAQDVRDALESLLAQGFGELTVTVREHNIEQIEALIRKKRKVARAGRLQEQR